VVARGCRARAVHPSVEGQHVALVAPRCTVSVVRDGSGVGPCRPGREGSLEHHPELNFARLGGSAGIARD
jgi:hypothetical protein